MDDSQIPEETTVLLDEALPWIDEHLARHGITRSGPPGDVRVRSWATVAPIPTDRGAHWFKAASTVTTHEIRLYPLLFSAAPDLVLHPVATESDRAWMILPDGGPSLRHTLPGGDLVDRLVEIAPRYAQLQRDLMPRVGSMLAMGVPDMRPDTLLQRFDDALDVARSLAPQADDAEAVNRVADQRPRIEAWVELLASSPIGPSLDHSDLHANNILLPDGPDSPGRIYDWGDSVIAHPFSTLLVMLRALMDALETTSDDPRLTRVRDAYLEPFTDLAPLADLVYVADAACWTSFVIRATTWTRVLALGPPANPDWSTAPLAWMKTFLNETWLDES